MKMTIPLPALKKQEESWLVTKKQKDKTLDGAAGKKTEKHKEGGTAKKTFEFTWKAQVNSKVKTKPLSKNNYNIIDH